MRLGAVLPGEGGTGNPVPGSAGAGSAGDAFRGAGCHRDLIVQLQVLLQCGALRIAAGLKDAAAPVEEMQAMRVKVSSAGHEQYGAWQEGAHDDLVFAIALACWAAKKVQPNPPMGDDRWWRNEHFREAEAALKRFTTEAQRPEEGL